MKDQAMLSYEFKETVKNIDLETRIYLDTESNSVILYQYKFHKDKILDTNCISIPIKEFGKTTKKVLKSFIYTHLS